MLRTRFALLIILQGIDAAGKDSSIKHVMSGVNPAGCNVSYFVRRRRKSSTTITCGAACASCRGVG